MLNPFVELLSKIIFLYNLVLITWIVIRTLIAFNIVNRYQPFVLRLNYVLSQLVEPALRPIRKFLPDLGGIDISPILLFLFLQFLNSALFTYFYNI